MGKAVGCFLGLVTFSLFAESIGVLLFALFIIFFLGEAVGENETLLLIYIIGAMAASYLLPVVLSFSFRSIFPLIIVPLITSFVFAFPSSFVLEAGCKAGNQEAVWAMRAVPVVWAAELLFANDHDDISSDCLRSQYLH